jgi:hypothetical protein
MLTRLLSLGVTMFALSFVSPVTGRAQDDDPPPTFTIAFVPYSLVKDIPHSGGGKNTSLTFDNRLGKGIRLWWIDGGGSRHSYGELAAATKKTQTSYAQHVWLITDLQDMPLGYFVASSVPALATIIPGEL